MFRNLGQMAKVLFFYCLQKSSNSRKGMCPGKLNVLQLYVKINCKQFFCLSSRAVHLVLVDFISEYTDDVL